MAVYAQWIIWILHTHQRQAVKTHAGMDFSYGARERGGAEENRRRGEGEEKKKKKQEAEREKERQREEEERARETQWSGAGLQENISCTV